MINKQELIIKINNNLSKLKKDKLIEFYNIFINKKGGSALRSLCNHINNHETEKKFNSERDKIKYEKLKYPPKYSQYESKYKELSKDIYAIYKFLTNAMFQEYDNYKTKNTELKFKFVCFTTNIKPIEFVGNPLLYISEFIENYFKLYSKQQKFNVKIVENSNKIHITYNNIDFYIIYTKEFNRINIVMTLEPVGENKAKEYFDHFPECYKPSSVSYVPTTTTTAFGTGLIQGVTFTLTDAQQEQIDKIFDSLNIEFSGIQKLTIESMDKNELNRILQILFELNKTKLEIHKIKISNYENLLNKYNELERIYNEMSYKIIVKILNLINKEINQITSDDKIKYDDLLKELNKLYDEKIKPIKNKFLSAISSTTYSKFNTIDNNNETYNLLINKILIFIKKLFSQHKISHNKTEIDKLYSDYKKIYQELLNVNNKKLCEEFYRLYNTYNDEIKKPIDIYNKDIEDVDILLVALIIYHYNTTTTNTRIKLNTYLSFYLNLLKKQLNSSYQEIRTFFNDNIFNQDEITHINWFNRYIYKPLEKINYYIPIGDYKDEYNEGKYKYERLLNLIDQYKKSYIILKSKLDDIVLLLSHNNKQDISVLKDDEPLYTNDYFKELNKILSNIITKDKYYDIKFKLQGIKEDIRSFKPNTNIIPQPAQLPQQPSPPKQPAPQQPSPPRREPAPSKPPAPIFDFNPEKLKAYRLATSLKRGGKKTKK